jgi:hypothetical protein
MATTWNDMTGWGEKPSAAKRLEDFLKGALAVNRAMETTLVDVVAAYTPWLASVIPAFLGFENVTRALSFLPWQAWIYAIVVECLGLATVSTTLKFWSWNQDGQGKQAPFWLAVTTALVYLTITLSVNVLLDEGSELVKVVKALMSSLSVVGALVLAMRSQQSKSETQVDDDRLAEEKAKAADQQRWDMARHQAQEDARLAREKELESVRLQHEKELETLRIQAEAQAREKEADRHFRKELKLAEMQLKVAEAQAKVAGNMVDGLESGWKVAGDAQNFPESGWKVAGDAQSFPESFQKVAEGENNFPATFGKWHDWRDLPEEHKKRIAGMTPKQVHREYGVPEKTSSNWARKANDLFGGE